MTEARTPIRAQTKKLVIAAVVAVATYAGLKAVIHYQAKVAVDDVLRFGSLLASTRYDGITSGMDGSVSIEALRIEPYAVRDLITIDSVTLRTPGLTYLLFRMGGLGRGELPEFLGFSLHGIALPGDGDIAERAPMALLVNAGQLSPRGVHCGQLRQLGASDFASLGYTRIESDVDIDLQSSDTQLDIEVRSSTRDMGSTIHRAVIAKPAGATIADVLQQALDIRSMKTQYTDDSFYSRLRKFCAAKNNTSEETFVDTVVDQSDTDYMQSWAFIPGAGIKQAYRRFWMSPGTFQIAARPTEPIDLRTLKNYSPTYLTRVLGLSATVNGESVEDLGLRVDETLLGNAARPPAPGSAGASPSLSFQPVAVGDLANYVGRKVRVHTREGPVRAGSLVASGTAEVMVRQQFRGGDSDVQILSSAIAKVEVLLPED